MFVQGYDFAVDNDVTRWSLDLQDPSQLFFISAQVIGLQYITSDQCVLISGSRKMSCNKILTLPELVDV